LQVAPLILKVEVYEEVAEQTKQAEETAVGAMHEHEDEGWQPQNGWERTLFTAGANAIVGLGFALVLAAIVSLSNRKIDWRTGLLWGLGGYAVFFVAPTLGLPPEVPGTEAAELHSRQLWWGMTALCTGGGLALLVFARHWAVKIGGAVLLAVPHLIGAPQPAHHYSAAPEEIARAFIYASAMANAALWLSLGGLFGFFHKKLA